MVSTRDGQVQTSLPPPSSFAGSSLRNRIRPQTTGHRAEAACPWPTISLVMVEPPTSRFFHIIYHSQHPLNHPIAESPRPDRMADGGQQLGGLSSAGDLFRCASQHSTSLRAPANVELSHINTPMPWMMDETGSSRAQPSTGVLL